MIEKIRVLTADAADHNRSHRTIMNKHVARSSHISWLCIIYLELHDDY